MRTAANRKTVRFQPRAARYWAALAGTAVLLVALPATPALRAEQAAAAPAAPATVPGSPGTAQSPTVLYSEDFENGQGTVPVRLTGYAGASGETYTADPAWLQNCNGWISAFDDPAGNSPLVAPQVADCTPKAGSPGSTGVVAWNAVRTLAQTLGVVNGSPDPSTNHAVSAYTNGPVNDGNPGANKVEFQTVQPVPVPQNGRFLTFTVNAAELNCARQPNHALLNFFLVNGATSIPVSSAPIDPCTAGTQVTPGVFAGTFAGNAPVLFPGSTLGVKLVNGQASGVGNDHAFDDIKVLDVTPQLDKSFSPATAQIGGTSTLTFTITNTSDLLAKRGWSFTDTLPAGLTLATPSAATTTCPAGTIAAAAGGGTVTVTDGALNQGQTSCTVSVKVTSATAGTYTNDATDITASTGLNPPGSTDVTFTGTPQIGIVKSVSPSWFSAAGQTLSYSFLVTNPSTVALSGITVNDTGLTGLSPIDCPLATLAAGAHETCTATYVTTAADVTAGSVNNTATATGTPPTGPPVTSDPSDATVPSVAGALTLLKTATPTTFDAAGQLITFDLLVTNTSTVTMSAITVGDVTTTVRNLPVFGATPVTCPQPVLGPGESEHCTVTYITKQTDVDAGGIHNVAVAQGTPPGSTTPIPSNESDVTVPAVQTPADTVVKSASPATYAVAGQPVEYRYLVTNTGNVTLSAIGVTDPLPGLSAVTCPDATLAPGRSETCTASYAITAADVTAGSVINTATAHGTPPDSDTPVVSGPSTATITEVPPAPAIKLVKSGTPATFDRAGQPVHYRYVVTNTGNVPLTGIGVTDPLPGLPAVSCPDSTLTEGASETCTATYSTTAADVAAGKVTNTATAHGTPPAGPAVVSPPSSVTITALLRPAIRVVKTATPGSFTAAGQTIAYRFQVTNTGNVTLTGVRVTDKLPGLSAIHCPSTTLAAGAAETCTATYRTTQADVAAGSVANGATAQGDPPGSHTPVVSPVSEVKVLAFVPVTG